MSGSHLFSIKYKILLISEENQGTLGMDAMGQNRRNGSLQRHDMHQLDAYDSD